MGIEWLTTGGSGATVYHCFKSTLTICRRLAKKNDMLGNFDSAPRHLTTTHLSSPRHQTLTHVNICRAICEGAVSAVCPDDL